MSNKKFILLAFLAILVFIPLLLIDWVMIIHVLRRGLQLEGLELYAVSGIFIGAITILPVIAISPALTARINKNRYSRWTNRSVEKESNSTIGFATLIFFAFAVIFLVISVTNPERFSIGQADPVLEMFPAEVADLIASVSEQGDENTVLTSLIIGLLPFLTTLISFSVYLLLCMDKKEERLKSEIHNCHKKIEQINREIDVIDSDIERADGEKAILDNISDSIGEIAHNVNEFISEKDVYINRIKYEQQQEFEMAQLSVEKQCFSDFREFYEHGRQRFENIKANREQWKETMVAWNDFCREERSRIEEEISKYCDS